MFGEKEKRKEKPKNSDIDSKVMKFALITLVLGMSVYLTLGILLMTNCPPPPDMIFDGTVSRLDPTHSPIIITHISGSATSAILNATATAEVEQGQ